MHYEKLIGLIPNWVGADFGDAGSGEPDVVMLQFKNREQACCVIRSSTGQSRMTHIEGAIDNLVEDVIISAVSTTHYDNGTTYFALNIGTDSGMATFHWAGDGYIPFDMEVLI